MTFIPTICLFLWISKYDYMIYLPRSIIKAPACMYSSMPTVLQTHFYHCGFHMHSSRGSSGPRAPCLYLSVTMLQRKLKFGLCPPLRSFRFAYPLSLLAGQMAFQRYLHHYHLLYFVLMTLANVSGSLFFDFCCYGLGLWTSRSYDNAHFKWQSHHLFELV